MNKSIANHFAESEKKNSEPKLKKKKKYKHMMLKWSEAIGSKINSIIIIKYCFFKLRWCRSMKVVFIFCFVLHHKIKFVYNVVQGVMVTALCDLVSVVCNEQSFIATSTRYGTSNIFAQWSITVSLKWYQKKKKKNSSEKFYF